MNKWFQIWFLTIITLLVFGYMMNIRIRIKEHNIDVVSGLRACVNADYLNAEAKSACMEAVIKQMN